MEAQHERRSVRSPWRLLPRSATDEVNLAVTLPSGQAFRWRRCETGDGKVTWTGVISKTVFFLRQDESAQGDSISYQCLPGTEQDHPDEKTEEKEEVAGTDGDHRNAEDLLLDYFQLRRYSMRDMMKEWLDGKTRRAEQSKPQEEDDKVKAEEEEEGREEGEKEEEQPGEAGEDEEDPAGSGEKESKLLAHFKAGAPRFGGLRLLRQDPLECLMCFICSQNNNIARITKMVEALCENYGEQIGEEEKEDGMRVTYHAFPTLEVLAKVPEARLKALGFGYRARYIPTAAKQILEKDIEGIGSGLLWLHGLRSSSVTKDVAQKELMSLMGIGRKVADCISLFSLDKSDVIPVDTHVWQIAKRFMPKLNGKGGKAITDAVYKDIGTFFKAEFGQHCGWAHSLLFAAELSVFKENGGAKRKQAAPQDEGQSPQKKRKGNSAASGKKRRGATRKTGGKTKQSTKRKRRR